VIRASEASVVADAASLIGKETEKNLSPEEIAFIESLGYSLKQ